MLVACMCNQPERLGAALAPLPLLVPAPVGRWGMAWVRSGEILVARTPRPGDAALDLGAALAEPRSDCAIAAVDGDDGDPDDLPPFRFRRWMLAETPTTPLPAEAWNALASHVPDFLRRNLRGRTCGELLLYTVIALLHDQGRADDLELRVDALASVADEAQRLLAAGRARLGLPPAVGAFALSNSRALVAIARDQPLAVHALTVANERGQRDPSFRGVAISSSLAPGKDAVPELAPPRSIVSVSRDLRVAIAPAA
ncbi:MAG: hypothetical protein KBG48_18575 [Kofleriaceae bacterium]|jgi:hypothetical protein|nr:hypothetical protein [Kofleriaceae bacterium]MBP9169412.1 hypothetical protein [Kofleriaceae bacterium]MBP9861323.1 hypothetical protein [Kofleriaceae bacterium]